MMQRIPATGPERERLREKGQFWTPDWVADAMVSYVMGDDNEEVFDPAVGAGAFFRAAKRIARARNRRPILAGMELHEAALREAVMSGLDETDLAGVRIQDFVLGPHDRTYRGIVANPPYIRHHRLSPQVKAALADYGRAVTGLRLDGRAGIHVYFLLRALELLSPGGRLAFIVSADTAEGVFARDLWSYIAASYDLQGIVTFHHDASPFPGVDTNPIIYLIRNLPPSGTVRWARCFEKGGQTLLDWVENDLPLPREEAALVVLDRAMEEALETGLSREPVAQEQLGPPLSAFASVCRGIATGANDFFVMTRRRMQETGIPERYFVRVVGRTRDVNGDTVGSEALAELEKKGRPTFLLSLNGDSPAILPDSVREYIRIGEETGVAQGTLLQTRNPWYRMEFRRPPAYLFAYLGRRSARFIRNDAGVVPLTGFLCVYPRSGDPDYVEKLWAVLSHPATQANLRLVGKSYGGGAIKVEPRALERLPLPRWLVDEVGLTQGQPRLSDDL